MIRIIIKNYENLKHMEYNSDNILKIEHFFHIPKNKGQKTMEKKYLFWKMYVYVAFPSHFSCIFMLTRDLAAIKKPTYFDGSF